MAGHSKWANIKHKKAKEDAKRGQAFTKLIKEITVVARQGGGEPTHNTRLRSLIEKAKSINMPQENITRAIKKGTGELPGVSYDPILYEGYGPSGIAVIVDALTDNKNRTVAELRRLFSSYGGNLAESGAVNWMFNKKGIVRLSSEVDEDTLLEQLLDQEIEDIDCGEGWCRIITPINSLENIKQSLENQGYTVESSEPEWVAKNIINIEEEAAAEKAYAFLQALQDHDDVNQIYTNLS